MEQILINYLRNKRKTPEVVQYIEDTTAFLNPSYNNISNSQRIWHIKNGVLKVVLCQMCKENLAIWSRAYTRYGCCSKDCSQKLVIDTTVKLHGEYDEKRIDELNEKRKKTSLLRYGTENYMDTIEGKTKVENTNLERYGVKKYSQLDEAKERVKSTTQERYGVDNVAQVESTITKRKETCIVKYGVDSSSKTIGFHIKIKSTNLEKYGMEYYSQSSEFKERRKKAYIKYAQRKVGDDYDILDYNIPVITIQHKSCGNVLKLNRWLMDLRINNKYGFCDVCRPINNNKSSGEAEIVDFVKSITDHEIILNSRKIIKPRELDIYIPELKLAIEYNGSFYHGDPRFYVDEDIVFGKSVKDIRQRDENKRIMCENLGIKLVVVWEYDWLRDQERTKNQLMRIFIS